MSKSYPIVYIAVISRMVIAVVTIAETASLLAGEMWLQAAIVACLGHGFASVNIKLGE